MCNRLARIPLPINAQAGKSNATGRPNKPASEEIMNRPNKNPVEEIRANRVIALAVGIPGMLPATDAYEGGIGDTPSPKIA